tara:strand:- start:173 stop:844 length:672 start_codon:yes stop_codon:yes gene_type:complete
MITFAQFSERLARGQLKNTSAVDDTNLGEICPEYEDTILSLTNQGLVDLSTRFPLITKQIDLTFVPGQHVYQLDSNNVGVFLDEAYTDTFDDTFVRVLDIWDTNGSRHPHDTNGHIMTPVYNSLRFSTDKMDELGEKVRIRYQARHAGIDADANIDIPPNLETALQLFVASLYISHMNGPDHSAKGDSYFAAYLRHIGEDEQRNTSSVSEIDQDTRFTDRGFV